MITHIKKLKERSHKSIFVLDDWPDIIEFFEHTGRKSDVDVIGVKSNAEARAKLDRLPEPKSLVVAFIDVEIGTDSGLDIFHEIRKKMPKLPTVIMTGRPNNKNLIELIAGDPYTSFLSKPFFMEEITEIIRNPCARAGDIRELVELAMFIEESKLL